ncbi:hypothetical protein BDW74DRAFT_159951 [Aspergillus multicolor]|uniref:uncharacterized protein n=1 Tax=Aspergillus multicolor TaxID=41759 RepID=UPI003CCD3089
MRMLAPALRGRSPRYLWSWRTDCPGWFLSFDVNRKGPGSINKGLIPFIHALFCSSYSGYHCSLLKTILRYLYFNQAMSDTSTLQQVTTNQSITERPLSQSTTASSATSALKQSESKTNKLAYLSTRTSNSPSMTRPATPRSYPAGMDTFVPRDSFSSTEDSPRRTQSPLPLQASPTRTSSNRSRGSDSRRRYDNTVYHYGRHSNYWLFGGFSVRDTVRDGVDWIRQQKKG